MPDVSAPVLTPDPPEDPPLDDEAELLTPPAIDCPAEATPDDELLLVTPAPTLLPTELTLEELLDAALAAPPAILAPTLATDILSPEK